MSAQATETATRRCRECGCTNDDCRQCIEKTGSPCSWVEADLCSACDTPATSKAAEWIDRNDRKMKREEEIRCPTCEHVLANQTEVMEDHITLFGSYYAGPVEHECPRCEVKFYVFEMIRRTYKVSIQRDEAAEWWK